jgi:TonB-linked SusC/RagA family outer membrane protein
MGRVNYAFMDRYLLTLTARQDGSSRLAPGNKWALFPSVALGWQLGDEPFLRDQNWFSNLKLRASYGRTGNTSVNPYQTQGGLSRTAYTFGDAGAFGYRPNVLKNPELKWEKTDQVDVGLEFGILEGRVSGTADVYRAMTRDLLMNRQLPPSTGFGAILQNIGETRNTGVELALNTIPVENFRGVRWTVDLQWSKNKNEIVSLYGGTKDDLGNRWFIGQPINGGGNEVFYDRVFAGIWQRADSLEARKYAQLPGQIRVADLNNDGQINDLDRRIIGNTYPTWTGAINTRVEYRGFDLSGMAITRQNYMVFNDFLAGNSTLAGRYNVVWQDYWLPDNPSNTAPRPNVAQESPIYVGTRGYEDASFWRIRNITLGYTVPNTMLRRAGAQTVRIYATAQDPFLFTKFTGLDPEGRASAGTPSTRTLLLGATATF